MHDGSGESVHYTTASCISTLLFRPVSQAQRDPDAEALWELAQSLRASMVLSQTDATTPLSVETLEVEAGVAGGALGKAPGKVQSSQTCQDCFELATPKLAEGTDFLRMEAKVMTGAAARRDIVVGCYVGVVVRDHAWSARSPEQLMHTRLNYHPCGLHICISSRRSEYQPATCLSSVKQ